MRNLVRLMACAALLALVASLACDAHAADGEQQQQQQQQLDQAATNIGDDKPPTLFGFQQFKILFHKSYKSIREELHRQTLFLGQLTRAFATYYGYKHKMSSSFEGISQMSDWTQSELRGTHLSAEEYYKNLPPGMDQDEQYAEYMRTQLIRAGASDEQENVPPVAHPVRAGRAEITGELAMTGDSGKRAEGPGGWLPFWTNGVQALANKLGDATERALQAGSTMMLNKGQGYRPDLPDEVLVDHRATSKCLTGVRNQGYCGSCYIFSTMALYEWAYCMKEGTPIKLSEQYIVDCGYMTGLKGCAGGNEHSVSAFVDELGLELLDRYRYRGTNSRCPYKQEQREKMGYLRVDKPSLAWVYPNQFDEELKVNPFIVTIYPSNRLHNYAGGVDDGQGCGKDLHDLHSVLLVGSGRQDGHEYWIMRNSYGTMWGEKGYYRLRKDSGCLANFSLGIKLQHKRNTGEGIEPKYEFSVNPNYDWKIMARMFNHRIPPRLPPKKADDDTKS